MNTYKNLFLIWLLISLAVGHFELLKAIPAPAVQGILFALTLSILILYKLNSNFRTIVKRMGSKSILKFHLIRFVGLYFLFLYSKDRLPYDFAVLGGIGDICVAVFSLFILVSSSRLKNIKLIFLWNVIGLIDILFVVGTAAKINLTSSGQLVELTHLPLSLLPTFIVPIIISSHVILFLLIKNKEISTT